MFYKMGAPIPGWLFTWPMILIAIGIMTGIRTRFHNPGSLILIVIGSIFLIDQVSPRMNFHDYILPAILISIGIIYIFRPRHTWYSGKRKWRRMDFAWESPLTNPTTAATPEPAPGVEDDAEFIDINAVFGGVKKVILSKNFKGGEINCFMGGTELNLMQADLQGTARLEVNNVFGGTKISVPSNWDLKNEVTAIFGGIEDKRSLTSAVRDPSKIIVLTGNCVFGGIEITNY